MSLGDALPPLLAVFFLALANGFFVAAEFSIVAIRRSRVEQLVREGHPFAPTLRRIVGRLDGYLAATQLGITMASIGLGWIGEPALAKLIEPLLSFLPGAWSLVGSHGVAIALAFAVITGLHIVLGELAPKSLALQRTEGTALLISKPLQLFFLVFRPLILLLNGAGNLVLRLVRLRPAGTEELVHSVDELRYLVAASHHAGMLDAMETEMVTRAFVFGETRVRAVMVPRTEMVAVAAERSIEDTLEVIAREGHSRIPIYDGTLDHVVGIVHLRDLARALRGGRTRSTPVRDIAREPLLVPETGSIETVLTEMRRRRRHVAIVVDEHGGTAGMLTLEDIVEQIVGEVQDEFEVPAELVRAEADGSYVVDGLMSLTEFGQWFGLELHEEGVETLGGLVMAQLGRVPQVGDTVSLDRVGLAVTGMDGRRVAKVRVRLVGSQGAPVK